jgi:hypothetical protein
MKMRKILSLTIMMMVVLAFGVAYAAEGMYNWRDADTFLNYIDPSTGRTAPLDTGFVPEETSAVGSAAGGVSVLVVEESLLFDINPNEGMTAPLDTGPFPEGTGIGGSAAGGMSDKADSFIHYIDPSAGHAAPFDTGPATW